MYRKLFLMAIFLCGTHMFDDVYFYVCIPSSKNGFETNFGQSSSSLCPALFANENLSGSMSFITIFIVYILNFSFTKSVENKIQICGIVYRILLTSISNYPSSPSSSFSFLYNSVMQIYMACRSLSLSLFLSFFLFVSRDKENDKLIHC